MLALRLRYGVGEALAHLCEYGSKIHWPDGEPMPAEKPMRFLSSAPELLKLLGQRCPQNNDLQQLIGGRVATATVYPSELCRAILKGIET